jgi:glycosyltransferase 2 family protein
LKKKVGRILSIILPLLLGVFLIIYMYRQFTPAELDKLMADFKNADYLYIYISLFIALTGYISRAYRWRYTLEHLGYESSLPVNFFAVCIGYLVNMTIPRSGEVARALVLKNYRNVPFDKAFGTIIAERIVDLILLVFFVAGTIILQFSSLKEYLLKNIPVEKMLFYGVLAGIFFIGAILLFMYSKSKWIKKLKIKVSGLTEGAMSVFRMKNKWPFLLHSVYIWVSYVAMFYITIYALPETTGISVGVVATAFVIGSLAITFSNGGFGVYPVVLATILELYGVPRATGTAFGWIVWSSQIGLIIILGGVSFLLLPLLYRNK